MKKNIRHLLHIVVFIAILTVILIKVTDIMENKYSREKYDSFITTDEKYDIFFLGSSHMMNGIDPIKLYNDYGITSYNFGNPDSHIAQTYYTLLNAMDYKTPKMVVIDMFFIESVTKITERIDMIHYGEDAFPLSYTKYIGINDLFDSFDDKIQMLFTLAKYHSRWTSLDREDFIVKADPFNGHKRLLTVETGLKEPEKIIDENIIPEEYTVNMEYLEKIIELCQEKDIEVLLCTIPYVFSEKKQIFQNYGYVLSEKYNIDYLNLIKFGIVDFDIDFSDKNHLNVSGADKITQFLGEYLSDNFDLQDHRSDDEIKVWSEKNKECDEIKNYSLIEQTTVNEYLMMLRYDIYECQIMLSNKITEESNPIIYKLIYNINGIKKAQYDFGNYTVYSNLSSDELYEASDEKADIYITVYSKATKAIVSQKEFNID